LSEVIGHERRFEVFEPITNLQPIPFRGLINGCSRESPRQSGGRAR
jgi:hypothetical protein